MSFYRQRHPRTMSWECVGKILTIGLFFHVAAVQASNISDPRKDIANNTTINRNADSVVVHRHHNADLKKLANMFRSNDDTHRSRLVRSLPFAKSPMCEVEQDTLIRFRDELRATLNGTNQANVNTCPLNFNSDKCEQLFNLVLCGYDHLKNGLLAATKNNIAMDEAVMLRNKLIEFQEKSSKLFDGKLASVSQKYKLGIQKLKTDMQVLQNKLTKIVDDLDAQTVKSCISEIASGKIESAAADLKKLNDDSKLEHIVISVYLRYGKIDQVLNLLKFIKKLPSCAQDKRALQALVQEMRRTNHLATPLVLLVSNAAKSCMLYSALDNDLKTYTGFVLDAWASKIRRNDYQQLIDFAKNHSDIFRKLIPILIDKAYTSLSNAEVMIQFIRNLPYIPDSIVGYSALFDKMKSNRNLNSYQLVMLAYRVKEYMGMNNYHNVDQENKYKFTILKNNLPSSVRDLIWSGSDCKIKNDHYGEYLYVTGSWRDYAIQTWVPGNTVVEAYWELQAQDNGKYFKIRNTHYNKYLGFSANKHNDKRRRTTTRDASSEEWTLIPVGDKFLLKDRRYQDYLYADYNKVDSDRRHVFGWIPSSIPDSVENERKWKIIC